MSRNLSPQTFADHPPLQRLPLVTLYATDRCNSRCITCDYWRHGRNSMTLESVGRLLPGLSRLGTEIALLSGGEPLLNPEWAEISGLLRSGGLEVWLLTSGLSLAKHARRATNLFQSITVSLDGTDASTYLAIRGLDAFDTVCHGIRLAVANGMPPSLRVTVQRGNYRQLPAFVDLAKELGARQVSFLAVDVANPHAFGRNDSLNDDLTLRAVELLEFDGILASMERDYSEDFDSGFIAESPTKLRRILQYFAALRGQGTYPPVRCNAPEFSAVLGATGKAQPCFFIAGPAVAGAFDLPGAEPDPLTAVLNSDSFMALRQTIRSGERAECARCVCSMWRDLDYADSSVAAALPAARAAL